MRSLVCCCFLFYNVAYLCIVCLFCSVPSVVCFVVCHRLFVVCFVCLFCVVCFVVCQLLFVVCHLLVVVWRLLCIGHCNTRSKLIIFFGTLTIDNR